MKAINRANLHLQNITVILARAFVVAGVVACVGSGFAQTLSIQSGSSIDVAQPAQPDSIVQLTAEAQGLSLVPPDALPKTGTFWLVMPGIGGGVTAPLPCPPNDASFPIYQIADGQFLVDATDGQVAVSPGFAGRRAAATTVTDALEQEASSVVNLITHIQTSAADQQTRATMQAMGMDVPSPGDGSSDTNGIMANGFSSSLTPDYGTNLWIAQVTVLSGNLNGIATNTQADIQYDIMSCTNLLQTDWQSEGLPIFGSETTNWTSFSVAQNGRPILFLRLRSDADDGSGLPIWWQLQYFGTTGVDPYGDPAGDGWSNLQKFQNGMNPNVFYTPPAPQGLTATYHSSSSTATISWQSSPGTVTGYTVEDSDGNTFNFSVGTTSFTASVPHIPNGQTTGDPTIYKTYQVQAHYAGGNSAWSAPASLENPQSFSAAIVASSNNVNLVVFGLPADTVAIRFTQVDWFAMDSYGDTNYNSSWDIPFGSFTNGAYSIPASWAPVVDSYGYYGSEYAWWVQAIGANGDVSAGNTLWADPYFMVEETSSGVLLPWYPRFFDGRMQLKQNLIFQLRAATVDFPFEFCQTSSGETTNPVSYVSAGFFQVDVSNPNPNWYFDQYKPVKENYLYRNFVFNTTNLNSNGRMTTGVGGSYYTYPYTLTLSNAPAFQFQVPTTFSTTLPALLATNQTRWLCSYPLDTPETYGIDGQMEYLDEIGVTNYYSGPNLFCKMFSGVRNFFGLPFLSANIASGSGTATLLAGSTLENVDGYFYPETAQPQFQTVEYDFWVPELDWLPGQSGFSPTNTSRLLITSSGESYIQVYGYENYDVFNVAAYAKLSVQNAYSGVYGYLQQYFDKAYKMTNGVATTNTTGILSPYGSFFATEPGPVALVTMPDIDTGARGTCTVYCVSLVLDKNHDGTMDTSFNGSDATSQVSPMEWWINNDCDWATSPGYPYFDPGSDKVVNPMYPDFYWDCRQPTPRSVRDLEDYARLWICGVPALTNAGYQVTMSWANVSSGSPAINLLRAVESNGGTHYLTDTNILSLSGVPWQQIGYGSGDFGLKYSVTATNTLALPINWFTNAGDKHFLFEGAGTGSGQLVLTISQNGNIIAQTGAWLDLHDVKDFYEQATITNNMSGAISNWSSTIEKVQPATSSALGDDTNLIVFVHGFNVGNDDWLIDSDTVFKRLYWAGYRGKFMTVKWPCEPLTLWNDISENTSIFNNSEIKSYKAGKALKNYLSQLRSRFPNYQLNVLAHSQGNAIMGEAIKQGAPFDTYILTQGAMPASSYDVNAPTDSTLLAAEFLYGTPEWQPMGYHGIYTNFTGRIVSCFNTNDSVLNVWMADQAAAKPDSYINHVLFPLAPYYSYDGANGWWHGIIYGLFSSYLVTDPQESRAMISRSHTQPIGRMGPSTGQTKQGVIGSTINLAAQFGFTTGFSEHSAEWTRPIQTSLPYYNQILIQIQPVP